MAHFIDNPPFELGETLDGVLADGSTLTNDGVLGGVYVFPHKPTANDTFGQKGRVTGKPLVAVALRNTAAHVLLGKRLGQLSRTAGHKMNKEVDGYSATLSNRGVVLIDPYLPSGGVAVNDIFWGIIKGPALCLLPLVGSDHTADIAVNDGLVAATGTTTSVTTSGRVTHVRFVNSTAGGTQASLNAYEMAVGFVGRAMSARTSQETTAGADLLVDFNIRFWQ